jgi:alkylhydroperoxidase family enzyme
MKGGMTMARIQPVSYEAASDAQKAQFDDQISKHGRITNMKKTLLHALPAFHALMEWYTLRDSVLEFLDEKSVNYFCHAISTQNNCLICSSFIRKIIIDRGENPDELVFSDKEQLLVDFGRCCATDANRIDDEMFSRLKGYFSDEQIVLLTAFAGLMIATNLINNALKVDLDPYLEDYVRR